MCRRSAQQSKLYEHQLRQASRCTNFPWIALREKWVKFVQRHRVDFKEPISKHAFLCSVHFERGCYENSLAFTLEGMANTKRNKVLIKGSIPTIHAVVSEVSEELTDRKKRQVSSDFQSSFDKVKRNRSEFIIFWL